MNSHLREVQHQTINGDVYDYYESIIDKIFSSGEGSDTKFLSFDSSEPPCPIGPGQFTRLKLTDGSCNLTSFDSSFIILRIKTNLSLTTDGNFDEYFNDNGAYVRDAIKNAPMLYVGFKTGLHAIDHYRFYCDKGRGYICEQSQAIYESAITWFTKSQQEIEGTKGCYATYEDILKCKSSLPGFYLTYKQVEDLIQNKSTLPVEFEVTIRYDDFAPLQFFKIFPNSVCGNLQMEFKINNNKNFVVCPIPFKNVVEYLRVNDFNSYTNLIMNGNEEADITGFIEKELDVFISHKFTNTLDYFNAAFPVIRCQTTRPTKHFDGANFTINTSSVSLLSARSYINGYNISQNSIDNLRMLFTNHKVYIPAQRIDQYSFSQTPTSTNMTCNTTQTLINCSSIGFMWPKTANQLTCSENPLCTSIQLMIDNKTYPDKPFSTYELSHSNYILNNLMFDDIFKPNHSLESSLDNGKNGEYKDKTNYLFIVSTERLDSDPYVFDGITKDNCFITLNGTFNTQESEYSMNPSRQPPIMFICQDTVWELSSEGVNYYYNDKNIIPSISNN